MTLDEHQQDAADLASFGYKQHLHRSLGSFSAFAAGFSYISILTGMFELTGFGYGFGGPRLFWTWIIVLAGQMAVALCFAELSARFPIAGSVYQWSKQLSRSWVSWTTGWTMLIGSIVTVAAVAVAWQIVLPPIWSGFEVFTNTTTNAVFLGCCLLVATTIINAAGVRVLSRVNNVGVAAELTGAVVLIVLLLLHAHRGPGVVLRSEGTGPGLPGYSFLGYGAGFLIAVIMPAYVMYGFDTAGSLAEETRDPRRRAPREIIRSLAVAGVAGMLLLLFAIMASPTLSPSKFSAGGLPLVVTSELGNTLGKVLLADVAIAISVCTLAIQTASIRMMFTMARDNGLPFGAALARVSKKAHSPVLPAIVTGGLAALALFVSLGEPKIFTAITSVSVVLIYIAYLLVTGPLLARRREDWLARHGGEGLFTLRRFGGAINAFAVVYGAAMIVDLIWPRAAIYGAGALAWTGLIFVVAVLAVGLAYYATVLRGRTDVLAEHRADPEPPAPAPDLRSLRPGAPEEPVG